MYSAPPIVFVISNNEVGKNQVEYGVLSVPLYTLSVSDTCMIWL